MLLHKEFKLHVLQNRYFTVCKCFIDQLSLYSESSIGFLALNSFYIDSNYLDQYVIFQLKCRQAFYGKDLRGLWKEIYIAC